MNIAPAADDGLMTVLTPLKLDTSKMVLRADYFDSQIDLEQLQSRLPLLKPLNPDPLSGWDVTVWNRKDRGVSGNILA